MNDTAILKNKAQDSQISTKKGSRNIKRNIGKKETNDNARFKTKIDKKQNVGDIANRNTRSRRRRHINRQEKVEEIGACPYCGSTNSTFDYILHQRICECGLVLEENIIDSSPMGTATNKEGQNLTQNGSPTKISLHNGGLATRFRLRDIPLEDRGRWARIHKQQKWSRINGGKERSLSRAFTLLASLTSRLSLPRSIQDEASAIYRKALDKDLIKGRRISDIVPAALYAACRICGLPRTFDEIAEAGNVSKKSITRNYRILSRELGLKLKPTSPTDYIPRFASNLNLSGQVEAKAIEIINEAKALGLTAGKTPNGIAAAALYCASILIGERRTQGEIAKVVGVTEVTLRNRYKEMIDGMDLSY